MTVPRRAPRARNPETPAAETQNEYEYTWW